MTDDGVPVSDQHRPIGFWLKLVDRLIDARFAETLDEHGVTRRQWQVLTLLRRGPASREELDVAVAPFLAATRPAALQPEHAEAAPVGTGASVDQSAADAASALLDDEARSPESASGDTASMEPESTAAEVDELVESQWVADSISGFVLTPKGEQSVTRIGELVDGIRAMVTTGVDERDYATTVATLAVMARNLGWRSR